jgi:outer membrane receptor protein involved in Fe transport
MPFPQTSQARNAGSAYITGVELSFEQHFTYLPGPLRGLGVLANYSHATSQATQVNPGLRSDNPALRGAALFTVQIPSESKGVGRLIVFALDEILRAALIKTEHLVIEIQP